MRKFLSLYVDRKTGKAMVYSECSYNQACFQLEYELENQGVVITDTKQTIINGVALTKIITNKKDCCFYYDEGRGYLMMD